jgi:hypothetical protein
MDMPTPDPSAIDPDGPFSRIFTKRLLQSLAATMPMGTRDGSPEWGEKWDATRELFFALNPRNPADAQLAAIGIASAQSAMDNFARAAQPGMSDDQVMRLRGRALSAGRAYATVLRYFRKQAKEAEAQVPAVDPVPAAAPVAPEPQPQDSTNLSPPSERRDQMMRPLLPSAGPPQPHDADHQPRRYAGADAMIAEQAAMRAAARFATGSAPLTNEVAGFGKPSAAVGGSNPRG